MELEAETSSRHAARVDDRDANEHKKIFFSGTARAATKYPSVRLFRTKKANYLNEVALNG